MLSLRRRSPAARFTFSMGGIHPPEAKEATRGLAIEDMPPPDFVTIPLARRIMQQARPVVAKKDVVTEGQLIGEVKGPLGADVHSSVAGTVKAVEMVSHPVLLRTLGVTIETDRAASRAVRLESAWEDLSNDEILSRIRQAGIIGLGGAGFPTHFKLKTPPNATVDTLLVNGAECEPYLTCDHRLMLEYPQEILTGVRMAMKVLGVSRAVIGLEVNKTDAVEAFRKVLGPGDKGIEVAVMQVKYPQGSEKQLIQAILGRVVPDMGLPFQVGVVVQNVATLYAVYEAVARGKPLYEKIVTVAGKAIRRPANLRVRLGTRLSDVAQYLGGTGPDLVKVVLGGPMMGQAVSDFSIPVTKAVGGILFLAADETDSSEPDPCIHCGRCLSACPLGLNPMEAGLFVEAGRYKDAVEHGIMSCFECGSCAYACPSRRPLVHFVRVAKMKNLKR